jgi:signal transduction histidine kinase
VVAVGWSGLASSDVPLGTTLVVSFAVLVWISARQQPRNRLVWVLTGYTISTAIFTFGTLLKAWTAPDIPLRLVTDTQVPSELPSAIATIEAWTITFSSLGFVGLLTFGILLFPDGRLPSRRWRPVAFLVGLGLLGGSFSNVVAWQPSNDVPPGENEIWLAFQILLPLSFLAALIAVVMRFRRGNPIERGQIKWVMWGAAVVLPVMFAALHFNMSLLIGLGLMVFVGAYGIAITKHQLFDIDVVISRSLVFGALAVFIGLVYVAVVVGVGTLAGAGDEPNAGLSIAATTLVAVSFQPLRRRFERVANRIVYGRRSTPYEVLSDFSQRVAATDEALLVDAARGLVDGTAAVRAVVSVAVGDRMVPTAAWPNANGQVSDADESESFEIRHDGTRLGELTLLSPRGQTLPEADYKLATEIASAMGLALRNQALTESLQVRVNELRESRQRLVAVQDDTRRKLERDLHDGAQQQLVALKVKLGLARQLAEKEGSARAIQMLEQLTGEADTAVDTMRDFARGVYPPLLEAEGLGSAIRSQARRAPMTVDVIDEGVGRYPRQVESTIYFCVLEALQNAAKYANAGNVTVTLTANDDSAAFRVSDDGDGFDPTNVTRGAGLTNMEDRLGAVGGALTLDSTPSGGTTIAGNAPIAADTGEVLIDMGTVS